MQLQIFKFQSQEEEMFNEVRTIEIDGKVWFVGVDVAKILGYAKPGNAVSAHCRERGTLKQGTPTTSGKQEMILIDEPNVYRLVMRSKLPLAEKFEDWLFDEVVPAIRKQGYYGKIDRTQAPNFYLRYKDNLHIIERGYFSVISELFVTLYSELEKFGYQIPDKALNGKGIYPDISVGKMFSSFLKKQDSEFQNSFKTYKHTFPDERQDVDARMYPIEALIVFRKFVYDVWIPINAEKYFSARDPLALDYLPKLLAG